MSECRLYPPGPQIDPNIRAAFENLSAALISDQMERTGGLDGLLPIGDVGSRVTVGRALTVKTRAGDNLVVHKAVDLARPGDFLVIDAGGLLDHAIIGEIWCRYAASRGVVGVALAGAVRDAHVLRSMDLPIFAQGITHQGPYKIGSGEIRGPIAIGSTVVTCGDYVIGDADGVVVVPSAEAPVVLASAERRLAVEKLMLKDIADGELDRGWIDAALAVIDVSESTVGA
jgi:regulator of RNase E activity RraA